MYLVVHTVPLDPEGRTSSLSEIHITDSWGYKADIRVKRWRWVRALIAHSVPPLQSSPFSSCCIGKDEMPRMAIERSHPGCVSKSYFARFVSNCIWLFLVYRGLTSVACTHTHRVLWKLLFILTHSKYLDSQARLCAWSKRSLFGWAVQHLFRVGSPLSWRMCIRATLQWEGRLRITDSADVIVQLTLSFRGCSKQQLVSARVMLMTVHSRSSLLANARNVCSDFFTAQLPELLEIRPCETLLLISTGCENSQIEQQAFQAS